MRINTGKDGNHKIPIIKNMRINTGKDGNHKISIIKKDEN